MSPDSNTLYGAQPTKRIRLSESHDEVIFVGINSTSASNGSEFNGPKSPKKTYSTITQFPTNTWNVSFEVSKLLQARR